MNRTILLSILCCVPAATTLAQQQLPAASAVPLTSSEPVPPEMPSFKKPPSSEYEQLQYEMEKFPGTWKLVEAKSDEQVAVSADITLWFEIEGNHLLMETTQNDQITICQMTLDVRETPYRFTQELQPVPKDARVVSLPQFGVYEFARPLDGPRQLKLNLSYDGHYPTSLDDKGSPQSARIRMVLERVPDSSAVDAVKVENTPLEFTAKTVEAMLKRKLNRPVRLGIDVESNSILVPRHHKITDEVRKVAKRYEAFAGTKPASNLPPADDQTQFDDPNETSRIGGAVDPSGEIKVFALKNSHATATANLLRQFITVAPFRAVADEPHNSVLVIGSAEQLQAVETLLLKLDEAPHEPIARPNQDGKSAVDKEASKQILQQVADLRSAYETANKQAHDLPESLRKTPDATKKSELRTAVQRTFTLRQRLLRAELQEMQARLEKTQQSLDMRERIADQIVDRRVEDLLNPQLEWEGSPQSTGVEQSSPVERFSTASPRSSNPSPPIEPVAEVSDDTQLDEPQKSLLAKLQGFWDFQELSVEHPEPRHFPNGPQMIYEIVGNRMASPPSHAYLPEWYLRFGTPGTPQPVDLTTDPDGGWPPQSTLIGIIEVTDDLVRICMNNSGGEDTERPTEFAVTKDTDILELRRRPAPVTELEGDWHMVSATDKEGTPVDVRPTNMTLKNDQYTLAGQGGQIDRRVEVYPDSKEIRFFRDESGFVQDNYLLEGEQLTIYGENRRNVYHRGHVALPKSIAKATDEQKTRWRSGIVDIIAHEANAPPMDQKRFGYGVIVSPQMWIVAQLKLPELSDGNWSYFAKFDDGGIVPIKIVEEGPQGWVTFQPEQSIEVNHHFQLSTAAVGQYDEVNFWGRSAKYSEQPIPELFTTTVTALDRKSPAVGKTVWQLFSHSRLEGSLPILDANGDVLAIALIGTGDLFLAVPVSQLKTMFPKSFGQ